MVVVLLPEPDGQVGQIEVSNPTGTQVLSRPWEATEIAGADQPPAEPVRLDEAEVQEMFGDALAAQPMPPQHFILYFEMDSTELTSESRDLLPGIVEAIRERKSVDTSVVGHTDTVGAKDHNYRLSLERATAIGDLLKSLGVDPAILSISSHGEEDLLVKTPDDVVEPRNRRVEVTVR